MSGEGTAGAAPVVDWPEIRQRMQRVADALEADRQLSMAEVREVLEERARTLARPLEAAPERDPLEVVRFGRGDAQYALESRYIHEVFPLGPLSFLPGVPPPVLGAVAWRGEVLVLMDVGRESGTVPAEGEVVVVGEERPAFGIVADAVGGLARMPPSALGDVGSAGTAERHWVRGITHEGVLVLDGAGLLQSHR